MTDIAEVTSQLEAFFQKRCPGGDSLKIAGYEPITGGYSRAMARVLVEDSDGRRGLHRPRRSATGPGHHRHRPERSGSSSRR